MLSGHKAVHIPGSNATLDVAREATAKSSRGLCGTGRWENVCVFFVDGCSL